MKTAQLSWDKEIQLAEEVLSLREHERLGVDDAVARVSEEFGVSKETIREALKQYLKTAQRSLDPSLELDPSTDDFILEYGDGRKEIIDNENAMDWLEHQGVTGYEAEKYLEDVANAGMPVDLPEEIAAIKPYAGNKQAQSTQPRIIWDSGTKLFNMSTQGTDSADKPNLSEAEFRNVMLTEYDLTRAQIDNNINDARQNADTWIGLELPYELRAQSTGDGSSNPQYSDVQVGDRVRIKPGCVGEDYQFVVDKILSDPSHPDKDSDQIYGESYGPVRRKEVEKVASKQSQATEEALKDIQMLVQRGYSDLDVMLHVKQKYPQNADQILTDAVSQGLVKMARIGGLIVESQGQYPILRDMLNSGDVVIVDRQYQVTRSNGEVVQLGSEGEEEKVEKYLSDNFGNL